jgi:hypothetical protein
MARIFGYNNVCCGWFSVNVYVLIFNYQESLFCCYVQVPKWSLSPGVMLLNWLRSSFIFVWLFILIGHHLHI